MPKTLNERLRAITLPAGIRYFEDGDGHISFPLYAMSGGIGAVLVCYLVLESTEHLVKGTDMGVPRNGVTDLGNGWKSLCLSIHPFEHNNIEQMVMSGCAVLKAASAKA